MGHPFRRYCYVLAEKLGMTVREVQSKMTSLEISEWMAFDMTQTEDWQKKYKQEQERLAAKQMNDMMNDQQRLDAFKALFKGNK